MTPAGRAVWALWASAVLCLAAIGGFDQLLRQAGRPDLVPRPLYPPFQSVPNPFGVHVLVGPLRVAWAAAAIVSGFGLVVAAASLVVRFRHARGTERQQLRWVALAAPCRGWWPWSPWPARCWVYDPWAAGPDLPAVWLDPGRP